jgi:hypothetical protein
MKFFRRKSINLPLVAVGVVAWLAISNHCALAALEGATNMPTPGCHAAAPAGHPPSPHNKTGGVECCKVLRATLLKSSSSLVAADAFAFVAQDYVVALISVTEEERLLRLTEWNTGPPLADSFAETVLQRSILAHAPPSPA